jgi:hypothetical protein
VGKRFRSRNRWTLFFGALISIFVSGIYAVADETPAHGMRGTHTCKAENQIDPYPIWKSVGSDEEARTFLASQYQKIGSVDGFADWLACQGFVVKMVVHPALNLRPGERLVIAVFFASKLDRKPLWGRRWINFPPVYSQSAILRIKASGRVRSIRIEYSVE